MNLTFLEFILMVTVFLVGLFANNYLPAYMKKKAEYLATKEDIGDITKEIESIKNELNLSSMISTNRWNLKREACLEALEIIDMQLSHQMISENIVKEEQDTIKARRCHTKLMLSCESTKLIDKFNEISFGPEVEDGKHIMERLNEFRNMIRVELDFGEALALSDERTWYGSMLHDKRLEEQKNETVK